MLMDWSLHSFFIQREINCLITPFTACQYPYAVQRYLLSNLKVVVKRTKFWTFIVVPNFKEAVTIKSYTSVITPI